MSAFLCNDNAKFFTSGIIVNHMMTLASVTDLIYIKRVYGYRR